MGEAEEQGPHGNGMHACMFGWRAIIGLAPNKAGRPANHDKRQLTLRIADDGPLLRPLRPPSAPAQASFLAGPSLLPPEGGGVRLVIIVLGRGRHDRQRQNKRQHRSGRWKLHLFATVLMVANENSLRAFSSAEAVYRLAQTQMNGDAGQQPPQCRRSICSLAALPSASYCPVRTNIVGRAGSALFGVADSHPKISE